MIIHFQVFTIHVLCICCKLFLFARLLQEQLILMWFFYDEQLCEKKFVFWVRLEIPDLRSVKKCQDCSICVLKSVSLITLCICLLVKKYISSSSELLSNNSLFGGQL